MKKTLLLTLSAIALSAIGITQTNANLAKPPDSTTYFGAVLKTPRDTKPNR